MLFNLMYNLIVDYIVNLKQKWIIIYKIFIDIKGYFLYIKYYLNITIINTIEGKWAIAYLQSN